MGPEARAPAAERLAARFGAHSAQTQAEAMLEARRAIAVAEALAREYEAGRRTQAQVESELRRQFPWLAGADGKRDKDLAGQLGHFGYYLVIM